MASISIQKLEDLKKRRISFLDLAGEWKDGNAESVFKKVLDERKDANFRN